MEITQVEYDGLMRNLNLALRSEETSFQVCLIKAISKADLGNLRKLKEGYPKEVFVYCSYIWGVNNAEEFTGIKLLRDA